MSEHKSIIERLVIVRYLLLKGKGFLNSRGPCSAGMAVSILQDLLEIFLRTLVATLDISINKDINFHALIDKINDKLGGRGPLRYKTAMNRLNHSRVNFKHMGNEPTGNDVSGFYRDIEIFLVDACREYLCEDFSDVSLADLVKHQRTRNWLIKAEEAIDSSDYKKAIEASAIAFTVYRKLLDEKFRSKCFPSITIEGDKNVQRFFYDVEKTLAEHDELLWLLSIGVDLPEYEMFKKRTPHVALLASGNVHTSARSIKILPNEQSADFCYQFVLQIILGLQETNNSGSLPNANTSDQEVMISKKCSLFLDRREIEVLKEVEVGAKFLSSSRRSKDGFLHVYFQGDNAYIKAVDAEIVL